MLTNSPSLAALTKAIVHFEDGDIMRLANWIGLLEDLRDEVEAVQHSLVEDLIDLIRSAIREGTPNGFLETLAKGLDELSRGQSEPDDGLWKEHGPVFVAEAKNRLARAQELVLGLENEASTEAVGELFRIVHTLKGEAGFLHQTELAARAHSLEELLDSIRSGAQELDTIVIDHLLGGVDALLAALGPTPTPPTSVQLHTKEVHRETTAGKMDDVLRIPAEKIDFLVSLIGELLVAIESENREPSPSVKKLSRGLQQSALRLRTEPLKDLLGRIKRGARDLAKTLEKPVDVVISGGELELDRNLIANLEEPLMHLIRNSLDHGIESQEKRLANGKAPQATLRLAAQRKGNRILLVVADDGAGLNTVRIWEKATKQGLVTGERPQDDAVVHALVFQPGFSTAENLTQVSGRGVGMDIVSSVVTANRGRVDLRSEEGKGTEITLNFPLSTAVLEGLIVRVGSRRFLVPVNSAIETLKVVPEALRSVAPNSRIFSLRGVALPVIALGEVLKATHSSGESSWGVLVDTTDSGRYILLVDEVESKKEVVIRALGGQFQNLKGVSAATILAGGTLALVLDIDQIVKMGQEAS